MGSSTKVGLNEELATTAWTNGKDRIKKKECFSLDERF